MRRSWLVWTTIVGVPLLGLAVVVGDVLYPGWLRNPTLLTPAAIGTSARQRGDQHRLSPASSSQRASDQSLGRMVRLPGGRFHMGDSFSVYAAERPSHEVELGSFWIDVHEVTNRQFREFVEQTGTITSAEQQGWAYVFDRRENRWVKRQGADWRHPFGPHSGIEGRDNYPVVQVSWYDAVAYARWAGKQLPTEAQWEYAARAGLRDAVYPWGNEELPGGRYQANYWQGWFPDEDLGADGHVGLAPVCSYPPNAFQLHDMGGNVWEWCADWYSADYYRGSPLYNPEGPAEGKMRVQRGGSWLCAENYCPGYRVTSRSKRSPESAYAHVGFRCVRQGP